MLNVKVLEEFIKFEYLVVLTVPPEYEDIYLIVKPLLILKVVIFMYKNPIIGSKKIVSIEEFHKIKSYETSILFL
jgi:hypothetical protein